jgi:hypothetical protein
MSKVQEKEATLLNNLSGSEIANELDSRLRDLEKNIAVAREFIKLADESYSELRHKWNLLHEEVRDKSLANTTARAVVADEKGEIRPGKEAHSKSKAKEAPKLDEPKSLSSADVVAQPEIHLKRAKTVNRSKKEPEISGENTDSLGPEKSSQPYRDPGRRRGKTSGRN